MNYSHASLSFIIPENNPQKSFSLFAPLWSSLSHSHVHIAIFYLEQVHFLTRVYKLCNRAFREYLEKEKRARGFFLSLSLLSFIFSGCASSQTSFPRHSLRHSLAVINSQRNSWEKRMLMEDRNEWNRSFAHSTLSIHTFLPKQFKLQLMLFLSLLHSLSLTYYWVTYLHEVLCSYKVKSAKICKKGRNERIGHVI